MATAIKIFGASTQSRDGDLTPCRERNMETISDLVHGFATQDIDRIMGHFAEDALYYDIMGRGWQGTEMRGKAAIRAAFIRQFAIAGRHTYAASNLLADETKGFASWTLILGDPSDSKSTKYAGIDEFIFDQQGLVASKRAWLKSVPALARNIIWNNPVGLIPQLRYLVKG